jgi:phosphatidylinositol phospholipase C delta
MKEVWGYRLLSAPVREKGHQQQEEAGSHVRLEELGSMIAVIVEYHLPDEADDSSSSSSSSSDSEDEKQAQEEYKAKKKAAPPTIIIPELAELGIYAQSVKPRDTSWYMDGKPKDGPTFHLINMSESGLASHMTDHAAEIARHNSKSLMRVFPKGTRISSRNLSPLSFWGVGAQVAALNWQTFNASMQLNDALFAGTAGYVLKPAALRSGGSGVLSEDAPRRVLRLRVAGATDVPLPNGREVDDLKPYLTCTLLQPGGNTGQITVKRKTAAYHRRTLSLPLLGPTSQPTQTDPVWNETLEWEFDDNQLVFVRMLIKSDDSFSSNPVLAVSAVRLLYVQPGWRFVRMLDLKGHETTCSLLVSFEVQNA